MNCSEPRRTIFIRRGTNEIPFNFKADDILNDVYESKLKTLKKEKDPLNKEYTKESIERLKNAERSWIKFRDDQCLLEGVESLGGTMEGLVIGSCQLDMTLNRIVTLRNLAGI